LKSEILIKYFEGQDYVVVSNDTYKQLTIAADLVFEKESLIKAVVIRESADSLSDAIIQRFSASTRIPSKTLEIYFSFHSKPNANILRTCKLFGVGILYLGRDGQVELYAESKQIKGRKIITAIPKTQIFFSSRQDLQERRDGEELINDQRDSLRVPIFPMLVENDQQYSSDIRKLWPIIERSMDECEYVLVILSGEYRKIIDRETRRALELYDPDEILFYVKSDKPTKDAWEELLRAASDCGVKFQEYFDLRDYKLKLNLRLMKIIKFLHEKHDVPFLPSDL
jgi:hypothetical protein